MLQNYRRQHRLFEIMRNSQSICLPFDLRVAVTCNQNYFCIRLAFPDGVDNIQAIAVFSSAKPHVSNNSAVFMDADKCNGCFKALAGIHQYVFLFEQSAVRKQDRSFVIDDQNSLVNASRQLFSQCNSHGGQVSKNMPGGDYLKYYILQRV